MRYVIKYTKGADIKFISHLDLMRIIQRIIRRTDIPIKYSKGFNPHMAISIAQPLSVGVYSDGEYMDIVLDGELNENEIIEKLNEKTVRGIRFLEAKKVREVLEGEKKLPQAMALLDAVRCTIKMPVSSEEGITKKLEEILAQESWVTMKKSKKGPKEADIRPFVKDIKCYVEGGNLVINTLIATGSREHLSPDLLARYIKSNIENVIEDEFIDIKREEMYVLRDEEYIPLYKSI
ncbi:TIGR03936 family radical SAM-associated protein [Clostridium gasigenes]|uniref:TIGR03936 family radical SAM-associated protein n=1 Tax=Clostridium gasigenes TaxID=94869 RepID=UPI001C0B1B9C|nr:TIGR03936 family radical SAM-associated protein [Clostridium gasigenes]